MWTSRRGMGALRSTDIVRVTVVLKPPRASRSHTWPNASDDVGPPLRGRPPDEPALRRLAPARELIESRSWCRSREEPAPHTWTPLVEDGDAGDHELGARDRRGATPAARERSGGGVGRPPAPATRSRAGPRRGRTRAGTVQWGDHDGNPPGVWLTDRDLRLMALLCDVNFLSARQLLLLGWGGLNGAPASSG